MSIPQLRRPLAVTAGEPAGIGPDLCLALADSELSRQLVVIGDPRMLDARARKLGLTVRIREYDPAVPAVNSDPTPGLRVISQALEHPEVCGAPHPANATSLLAGLKLAVQGCLDGRFAGMVTAPLQKSVINDAGIPFTGHTEYLAALTAVPVPVMLLVAGQLRVALASTHLPLKDVPAFLTAARLSAVIDVLHRELQAKFRIEQPSILVCGLNPHAGEGGHLGSEEQQIIAPVIRQMRERGMNIRGPVPADTAFTPAAGYADAILAMYHDQGLPVLKYAGFGTAVNVTLGLPIVRTSVDHGTALDIAGSGTADPSSLRAAVELAASLSAG